MDFVVDFLNVLSELLNTFFDSLFYASKFVLICFCIIWLIVDINIKCPSFFKSKKSNSPPSGEDK